MKKYIILLTLFLPLSLSLNGMDTQESPHASTASYQELEQRFVAPIMGNQEQMQQVAFILCIRERLLEAYVAEKIAKSANWDLFEWDKATKDLFNIEMLAFNKADDTVKNLLLSADNALEDYGSPFTFKDFSLLTEARKECADALYAYTSTMFALKYFSDNLQVHIAQLQSDGENPELKALLLIGAKVKQINGVLDRLDRLDLQKKIEYIDLDAIKPNIILESKYSYQYQRKCLISLNEFPNQVLSRITLTPDQRERIDRYVVHLINCLQSILEANDRSIKLTDGLQNIGYDLQKHATRIYENATVLKTLYAHWYNRLYNNLLPEYKIVAYDHRKLLPLPETIFLINQLLSNTTSKDYEYGIQALENVIQTNTLIADYSRTVIANSPELQASLTAKVARSGHPVTLELTAQQLKFQNCSNKMKQKVENLKLERVRKQYQAQEALSSTLAINYPLIKDTLFDLSLWNMMYATIWYDNRQPYFEWMEPTWRFANALPHLEPILKYYITLLKHHKAHATQGTPEINEIASSIPIAKVNNSKSKKSKIKGKEATRKLKVKKAPTTSSSIEHIDQEESSCSTSLPASAPQASTNLSTLKQFANKIRSLLVSSDTVLHRSDDYIAIRQHRSETTNEAMTLIIYNDNDQSLETLPNVKLSVEYQQKIIKPHQDDAWDRFHSFSKVVDRYLPYGHFIDSSNQNAQPNNALMSTINLKPLDNNHYAYVIPGKIMGKYYDHTRALADRDIDNVSGFSGAFAYIFDKTTNECVHRCFHEYSRS
jgi:hypothetical protein